MSGPSIPQELLDQLGAAQDALTVATELDAARAEVAAQLATVQEQDRSAQDAALTAHTEATNKALSAIAALRQHFGLPDAGAAGQPGPTPAAPGQPAAAVAPGGATVAPPAAEPAFTYKSPVAKKREAEAAKQKG